MKKLALLVVFSGFAQAIFGQHTNHAHTAKALEVVPVFNTPLSDEALKGFQFESMTLKIPAGYADSIAHRHDADLFGYVTKGSVKIELENKGLISYQEGQIFYESRNILHTRLENGDKNSPAEVLLIYIIKQGRNRYTKEK